MSNAPGEAPPKTSKAVDPVTIAVIDNRIDEIVREMQHIMFRTGYSTIIRDMKDGSAGICLPDGRVIGQDFRLPLHCGVFPPTVEAIYEAYGRDNINEGDTFLVNDPYHSGANHAPDFLVVTPAFRDGEIQAFCLTIAHKPDIGGIAPGSMSSESREIYHEGLLLPPVKYRDSGEVQTDVERIIENNSRTPQVTLGDLRGQVGSTNIGIEKLTELFEDYGVETVQHAAEEILESTREAVADGIREWDGEVTVRGELDSVVDRDPVVFQLTVRTLRGETHLEFDFHGSDPQLEGPANIQPHVAKSACMIGVVGIVDPELPLNAGVADVCAFTFPPDSVVNPTPPAPCANYARGLGVLTHLGLRALSAFAPDRGVAETSNRAAITVTYPEARETTGSVAHFEILGSAYGGNNAADGANCMATSYESNVRFTPIEIIETEFPIRVSQFEPAIDSAGAGKHRGGVGFLREYTLLADADFNYAGSNHSVSARGVAGGRDAPHSNCLLNPDTDEEAELGPIQRTDVSAGEVVRLVRAGGAGYGDPQDRDPTAVLQDVRSELVSPEAAREVYGVAIEVTDDGLAIDREITERLRG